MKLYIKIIYSEHKFSKKFRLAQFENMPINHLSPTVADILKFDFIDNPCKYLNSDWLMRMQ